MKTTLLRRPSLFATTSPAYRRRTSGEVEPEGSRSIPATSPGSFGEVRRGWRGKPQ